MERGVRQMAGRGALQTGGTTVPIATFLNWGWMMERVVQAGGRRWGAVQTGWTTTPIVGPAFLHLAGDDGNLGGCVALQTGTAEPFCRGG